MIVNMINNKLKTNMCTSGYGSYNFVNFIVFPRMSITTFENNNNIKYSRNIINLFTNILVYQDKLSY